MEGKLHFSPFLLKEKVLCFMPSSYSTDLCHLLRATCPFSLGQYTEIPGHWIQAPLLPLPTEGGASALCASSQSHSVSMTAEGCLPLFLEGEGTGVLATWVQAPLLSFPPSGGVSGLCNCFALCNTLVS